MQVNQMTDEMWAALPHDAYVPYSVDISTDGTRALLALGTEDPDFPELWIYHANTSSAQRIDDRSVLVDVDEPDGTATLTVTRTGDTTTAVSVEFTSADGTAVEGADYTDASGTLTFAAGVTTQTIDVAIVDDMLVEGPESFTVSLSNPSSGATLGVSATATVARRNRRARAAWPGVVTVIRGRPRLRWSACP